MAPRKDDPAPSSLVKSSIYLFEDEDEAVKRAARRERCSRAEIIRRAIRAYLRIDTGSGES